MAVGFRRTLNALTSPKAVAPSFLLDCARPKKLSYARVRSISLPVRLHPLVAALHDSARALLAWADEPAQTGPAWVADGAGRAGRVLAGLAGLLHHPQARDALQRPWTEQLLDDLLLLADFHGCFRESLVTLRQLLAETHASLRRRDGVRLAAALRAGGLPPGVLCAGPLSSGLPRRRPGRRHPRRRVRRRHGRRGGRLCRHLLRRVLRLRRIRRERRAVAEDPDALLPCSRPGQPDVAGHRPPPPEADRVLLLRGLLQRGGGGEEGGHGQGAGPRGVRRGRRDQRRGGVPRARERQGVAAQPAHTHILTTPPLFFLPCVLLQSSERLIFLEQGCLSM